MSKHDLKQVSSNDNEDLWLKYAKITAIVALYWFVSITMVFLNKQILSGSNFSLNAPLFITWFQCVITLLITIVGSALMNTSAEGVKQLDNAVSTFPRIYLRFKTVRQILPLTIVFVGMISFNNLCLKNVGVAFYFVGRSLTTVFNVALTYFILSKATSPKAIVCCLAIVLGFLLGVDQEQLIGTLSISGVVYGVLASFFVSLNSIFTVNALAAVNNSIWLLTFYNNLIACFLFLPLMILTGEVGTIFVSFELMSNPIFWSLMILSGIMGFAIGYVTNMQIKYTSPLTHNISGTAKACAQTVLATYLYSEHKTFNWWLSNVIVLLASASYTRVKQLEMKNAHMLNTKAESRNAEDKEALLGVETHSFEDLSRKRSKPESV